MRYKYDYNGDSYEISLERLADGRIRAQIGERTLIVHAHALADGGWLLVHEGRQYRLYGASQGAERYVQLDGEHFHLTRQDGRRGRKGSQKSGGDMTAQMPSQIMEVLVSEGEQVTAGQALVVLEAMKMEIRVTAQADGRVARVLVQVGQIVERGQVLIELEHSD